MILDITKIKVGDRLRVSDTGDIVEVRAIDPTDKIQPLAIRAPKDFAINVVLNPLEVITLKKCLGDTGWLFRSFDDVVGNSSISPEDLEHVLGEHRLLTLHDLEIIEPS